MDIPAPKAYLLTENKAFSNRYAVAIEFFDDLKTLPNESYSEEMKRDIAAHIAFVSLIHIEDIPQMNVHGSRVVSYDFADAFDIDEEIEKIIKAAKRDSDRAINRVLIHLADFTTHLRNVSFDMPNVAEEFGIDAEFFKEWMIKASKRIGSITEEEIEEMSDELNQMYPFEICAYYKECIRRIQK